jgi:hypothetical protein
MKKDLLPENWENGYRGFLAVPGASPPEEVTARVAAIVEHDLRPSELRVFSRLAQVHLIAGTATLLVCPQFGLSLSGHQINLMHYFMRFGPHGCMFACGAFFLGLSALCAGFLLRPEELRVIRSSWLVQFVGLVLASFGALICLGGSLVPLSYGLAWLTGSAVASAAALEGAVRVRFGSAVN